jgi:hypothetical protein
MIIVFEGADGAGKSTLARRLEKEFHWTYYHSGGPKTKAEMETVLMDLENMYYSRDIFLVDRHPAVSEFIYAKAAGKEICCPIGDLVEAWDHINLVVHCVAPRGDYQISKEKKAHKPIGHLRMVENQQERIRDMYEDFFFLKRPFDSIRVNTRDEGDIRTLVKIAGGLE